MRLMRNSLVIASLGLVLTTGLHAQQTNVGNITGSVQDATAAIVPGAEVLVVNTATGVAQSASTTSAGLYNINLLPVGSYTVTVTKTGFQKEKKINVEVLTGQTSTVDLFCGWARPNAQSQSCIPKMSPGQNSDLIVSS